MNNEFPDLELEARLTEALAKLPDAPVPSNFTARVMQAIDSDEARSQHKWKFNFHALLPRNAVATVVIVFASLAFHQHEISSQRRAIAASVALVAGQPVPS